MQQRWNRARFKDAVPERSSDVRVAARRERQHKVFTLCRRHTDEFGQPGDSDLSPEVLVSAEVKPKKNGFLHQLGVQQTI